MSMSWYSGITMGVAKTFCRRSPHFKERTLEVKDTTKKKMVNGVMFTRRIGLIATATAWRSICRKDPTKLIPKVTCATFAATWPNFDNLRMVRLHWGQYLACLSHALGMVGEDGVDCTADAGIVKEGRPPKRSIHFWKICTPRSLVVGYMSCHDEELELV